MHRRSENGSAIRNIVDCEGRASGKQFAKYIRRESQSAVAFIWASIQLEVPLSLKRGNKQGETPLSASHPRKTRGMYTHMPIKTVVLGTYPVAYFLDTVGEAWGQVFILPS